MFEGEIDQSLVQELCKRARELEETTNKMIDNLYAELEAVTSAADRNSVLLNKVTRQNREYLERIKELEEQLANSKTTRITDRSSLETDSTNELMSLIDDEDCKSRKRLISDSESTNDPLIVRKKRKRFISDKLSDKLSVIMI